MPRKPPKSCRHPGCSELTRDIYCPSHRSLHNDYEKAVRRDYEKRYSANRDPFYHTAQWQKLRDWFAVKHPLCQECFKSGRIVPMKIVDHIIAVKDGGDKLDPDNLQSLCRECHDRKTGDAQRKRGAVKGYRYSLDRRPTAA